MYISIYIYIYIEREREREGERERECECTVNIWMVLIQHFCFKNSTEKYVNRKRTVVW